MSLRLILENIDADVFWSWLHDYSWNMYARYSIRDDVKLLVETDHQREEWESFDPSEPPSWLYCVSMTPIPMELGSHMVEQILVEISPHKKYGTPGIKVKIQSDAPESRPVRDELVAGIAREWPEARTQLQDQGWVLDCESAESRNIDLDEEDWETKLPSAAMKKHRKDYSHNTAIDIIKAIPKAWDQYELDGRSGQWGPGRIAATIGINRDTVSRYHGDLWTAGIRTVNGIPIPYRPRRTQE